MNKNQIKMSKKNRQPLQTCSPFAARLCRPVAEPFAARLCSQSFSPLFLPEVTICLGRPYFFGVGFGLIFFGASLFFLGRPYFFWGGFVAIFFGASLFFLGSFLVQANYEFDQNCCKFTAVLINMIKTAVNLQQF